MHQNHNPKFFPYLFQSRKTTPIDIVPSNYSKASLQNHPIATRIQKNNASS